MNLLLYSRSCKSIVVLIEYWIINPACGASLSTTSGGMHALSLQLAENYVTAFGRLAEGSNTLIVPADAANTAQMLGQALGVFRAVDKSGKVHGRS